MTPLVWTMLIAIGALAIYYFHQRHAELNNIVTEWFPQADDASMVTNVIQACSLAVEELTIVDYRTDPAPALHQNADLVRAIDEALNRNPELLVAVATAARRQTWLLKELASRPRCITVTNAVSASGFALTVLVDGGQHAYVANTIGKAVRHDCTAAGPDAIWMTLGAEIDTANEIFADAIEQQAAEDAHAAEHAVLPAGRRVRHQP